MGPHLKMKQEKLRGQPKPPKQSKNIHSRLKEKFLLHLRKHPPSYYPLTTDRFQKGLILNIFSLSLPLSFT